MLVVSFTTTKKNKEKHWWKNKRDMVESHAGTDLVDFNVQDYS